MTSIVDRFLVMEATGLVITLLSGLAIAVIGVLYLVRPRAVAAGFGLPVLPSPDATAWLRLKGVRDLTAGIVAGVLLLTAPPVVTGWVLLAFVLIPLGDALTVLGSRGKTWAAWGIHGATAAIMLVGALLLLLAAR